MDYEIIFPFLTFVLGLLVGERIASYFDRKKGKIP